MTTLSGVFMPQLGASVDGLTVEAYVVDGFGGANNPPHLGDTPPGSPDASGTTSTDFGNHGAWELSVTTNEDYFVVVEYNPGTGLTYYWQRCNAALFVDAADGTLDVPIFAIGSKVTYPVDTTAGSISTVGATKSGGGTIPFAAYIDHVHDGVGNSLELSGASTATRYVGGTAGGHPTSGTFAAGDFIVDLTGGVWVCTSAGSPGTWVQVGSGAGGGANSGDIKAFAGVNPPSDWLACDGSAVSRSTYLNLFRALSFGAVVTGGANLHSNTTVDGIASTSGWQVGWAITGSGIPANTTIASITSATSITISASATSTGATTINVGGLTGNTHSNTTIDNISPNTTGLQIGWPISGSGIPAGATIASIDSSTQIHISANATATASTVSIVSGPWGVGNGSTTFNVPDLRGRTIVGASALGTNAQPTVALGGSNWAVTSGVGAGGSGSGEAEHQLSVAELASHNHGGVTGIESAHHAHQEQFISDVLAGTGSTLGAMAGTTHPQATSGQATLPETTDHTHSLTAAGLGSSHNNMPPFAGVDYIIKT